MILTLSLLLAVAAAGLPSGVLWAAGFAAFVGFIFGSVPPHGENRGWRFDMPGAVLWAAAGALVVGGLTSFALSGFAVPALVVSGFGLLLGVMRLIATRPSAFASRGGSTKRYHSCRRRHACGKIQSSQAPLLPCRFS